MFTNAERIQIRAAIAYLGEWIAALRSGNFEQTQSTLTRVDGSGRKAYCCLGVACEIEGLPQRIAIVEGEGIFIEYGSEQSRSLPPSDSQYNEVLSTIAKWLRKSRDITHTTMEDFPMTNTLVDLNDDKRASFSDIANHLEKVWLRALENAVITLALRIDGTEV